jgi:hypothetical protein
MEPCNASSAAPDGTFACHAYHEALEGGSVTEVWERHGGYTVDGVERPGGCARHCCEAAGCAGFDWRIGNYLTNPEEGHCILRGTINGMVPMPSQTEEQWQLSEQWLCVLHHAPV